MAVKPQTRKETGWTSCNASICSDCPEAGGPRRRYGTCHNCPQENSSAHLPKEPRGTLLSLHGPGTTLNSLSLWGSASQDSALDVSAHHHRGGPEELRQTDGLLDASHGEAACYLVSGLKGSWRLPGPSPHGTDGETEAQGARSDTKPYGQSRVLSEPGNPSSIAGEEHVSLL